MRKRRQMMTAKDFKWVLSIVKGLLYTFYPKTKSVGVENIPDEPSIFVGNHSQMHGPIICELYFPVERVTWCAGPMMKLKEVPPYAFEDFWSGKPKWTHPFFKMMSYLIAPLSAAVFGNAETVPVYRDSRILGTFRTTLTRLDEGKHVVIFPEKNKRYNQIIYDYQEKFIDTARLYYKKTGKELSFVPFYIAPKLKTMYFGTPITFSGTAPLEEERARIRTHLMDEMTRLGEAAPLHTVIPYRNIPKKEYPKNLPRKEYFHEKSGSKLP